MIDVALLITVVCLVCIGLRLAIEFYNEARRRILFRRVRLEQERFDAEWAAKQRPR